MEGENLRNGEDDSYIFGSGIWVDGRPFAEMRKMGDIRFSKQVRCATPPFCHLEVTKPPGRGPGRWDEILLRDWIENEIFSLGNDGAQ